MWIMFLTVAAGALLCWLAYWLNEARGYAQSGYIPPESSWFSRLAYFWLGRLLLFLSVGPIKLVDRRKMPERGRVVLVANHQFPCDFALVQQCARRHFRALGDAAQFQGFMGVLAAWTGNISVKFGSKEERAAGEKACIKALSEEPRGLAISAKVARNLALALLACGFLALMHGFVWIALSSLAGLCLVGSLTGGDAALAIAPQGTLLPENQLLKEQFRAGAVRIARAVAEKTGEPVLIVPMAFHYKRTCRKQSWLDRLLKPTRSMFKGISNPSYFDPVFKLELQDLDADKRAAVLAERDAKMKAYEHSNVTLYGAVAVVGEPIDSAQLPADPREAIELIRQKIVQLSQEAERH